MWKTCIAALLLFVSTSVLAQNCPPLGTPSPVPSNSPDDIPPGSNAWLVNHNGQLYRGGPNHMIAYVQTGANEQKVWYSIDAHGPRYFIYYNRRYRASATSPWNWEYQYSQPVTTFSAFVTSVLYSSTAKYKDNAGVPHKYVMYLVYQPQACDYQTAGVAMVSFSDNGTCWSEMVPLRHEGGPSHACVPELGSNLVLVEAMSAIDSGIRVYLLGVEGDVSILAPPQNMDDPRTSWGYSGYGMMTTLQMTSQHAMSSYGVFSPLAPGTHVPYSPSDPNRFRSYAYFFNLSTTFDPTTGDLYVTRGYPYPYDRRSDLGVNTWIPSLAQRTEGYEWNSAAGVNQSVQGCGASPVTYPNRYQVYRMRIYGVENFSMIHTGTWTLVTDNGRHVGYENINGVNVPLVTYQTAGTRDSGAATFIRNGAGHLVRENGVASVFAGNTIRESLSVGPCLTTGFERVVLTPIP